MVCLFSFFKDFFDVDHFLSLYWICYNTAPVLCFGFWLRGMWDLSSPTRDGARTPCIGRWSLDHWTARVVPRQWFLNFIFKRKKKKYIYIYIYIYGTRLNVWFLISFSVISFEKNVTWVCSDIFHHILSKDVFIWNIFILARYRWREE